MELHVHTKHSKDSFLCFWPLYWKCRICNIQVIAVTEHNNLSGGQKFSDFCTRRGGRVKVIVGEEIMTAQGEIIGLFLKNEIQPGLLAEQTISQIKAQGGVVYVPHPYDLKRAKSVLSETVLSKCRMDIDCIEVHNGRNIDAQYSEEQRAIGKKYGLQFVVGSDAHTLLEVGRNYMEIDHIPAGAEDFCRTIQTALFYEKECLIGAHLITKFVKFIKLFCRGNFDELYQLIFQRIRKYQHSDGKRDI